MIKRIRLYVNNNDKSLKNAKIVKDKFIKNGYIIDNKNYDMAISIGGDGAFLRMVRSCNYDSNPYYVGINSGTLGFLAEVEVNDVDSFIDRLNSNAYYDNKVNIQKTIINYDNKEEILFSLNDVIIRYNNCKVLKSDIYCNNKLFENYTGDGIIISTSIGSTGHNASYGGASIDTIFPSIQVTPMGAISTKAYNSYRNPVIFNENAIIKIVPRDNLNNYFITYDGIDKNYSNVESVESRLDKNKIKMLKLNNYSFATRIHNKLISD